MVARGLSSRSFLKFLVFAAVSALAAGRAFAATFLVTPTADAVDADPGNGICATARGPCSLRAAVQEANALAGADRIILLPGVYQLSLLGSGEDAAATGDLDVTDDLTVRGLNAFFTTIDGLGADRVFDSTSGPPAAARPRLTLRHVRVFNGNAPGNGGGIRFNGALDLEFVIVVGNEAESGGGIAAVEGLDPGQVLTIAQSIVSLNRARSGFGGGISSRNAVRTDIVNSIVVANEASDGGAGIELRPVDLVGQEEASSIVNTIVYGNRAPPDASSLGGGIFGGCVRIARSWIAQNTAALGGGVNTGCAEIVNSTINGNFAFEGGGLLADGRVSVLHVTVAGNATFSGDSAGVSDWQVGDITIQSSILDQGPGRNCGGNGILTADLGSNVASDATCPFGGSSLENTDPMLLPVANYGGFTPVAAIPGDSPAVDFVDDAAGVAIDQRGVARPQGPRNDAGAFEFNGRRTAPPGGLLAEFRRIPNGLPPSLRDALPRFTAAARQCDLDQDQDVDFNDLDVVIARDRGDAGRATPGDGRQLARCVARCTRPGCETR